MARLARGEVLDPDQVQIAHVYNRTVRHCFLMGDDPVWGKNFDHRKVWIEDYLREFAGVCGIDLLGFAILSNHFHLILRSRLSNISCWMRLLCQRVAQRAKREDEEIGDFFQSRYKAVLLLDEAALVACAAYIDPNPIRAAMAETIEASDHTSFQRRIEAMREEAESRQRVGRVTREGDTGDGDRSADPPSSVLPAPRRPPGRPADSILAPLQIDESRAPTGSYPSPGGSDRCSDQGFLAMSLSDYLQLLERKGDRGRFRNRARRALFLARVLFSPDLGIRQRSGGSRGRAYAFASELPSTVA